MRAEYLNDLDLGEEGGVKNVLVTPETVTGLPEGVRGWATLADTAKMIGKSESYIRDLAYKRAIPSRWFKKRQSDRMGICLVPVWEALSYSVQEMCDALRKQKATIEEALRSEGIDDATISEVMDQRQAEIDKTIQKFQGGLSREKA
jgi:hypothetical protein